MKNLTITLILLLGLVTNSYSQKTYYNPSNNVNVTITVREPYRPVDYSKIGKDFNDMLENQKQKREELIRYYDGIFFETKNSVINNTILTTDNPINNKILMVQRRVIEKIDLYNKLWREGLLKTKDFESNLRKIYYTYMETNQVFLQIVQYKYNKNLELKDEIKIKEHDQIYTKTLNSIRDFKINGLGEIEFYGSNLVYPQKKISNNLYDFVTRFGQEKFKTYQLPYNITKTNKDKLISFIGEEKYKTYELTYDKTQTETDFLISFRKDVLKIRKRKLSQFIKNGNEKEIRELEFQFYQNVLEELLKIDQRLKYYKFDDEITFYLREDENLICFNFISFSDLTSILMELRMFSISNILILLIEDFWEDPTRTGLSQKEIISIKNLPFWI